MTLFDVHFILLNTRKEYKMYKLARHCVPETTLVFGS